MERISFTGKRWIVEQDFRSLPDRPEPVLEHLHASRALGGERSFPLEGPGSAPPDLVSAIERIEGALASRERIAIFGDYDCDGITSALQLQRCLARRGGDPRVILPNRITDGYDIRTSFIDRMASEGVTLLLTVDTGITAAAAVRHAREQGMDVVIFDHHVIPKELPEAFAIVHPSLAAEPGVLPSAAGVVFGFVSAFEGVSWEGRGMDLALAAIGTIGDLVELRGANRALAKAGLEELNAMRGGPLRALCDAAGCTGGITSRDVAFRIVPRINAAGRMEDPSIALRALQGDAPSLARLQELNTQRQECVQQILRDLGTSARSDSRRFLCLAGDYPVGVVGLLAGKLTETFGKPSLVANVRDGFCTASARSVPGFHVTEALRFCSDLLLSFGGHAQAAGCTFRHEALEGLAERLHGRALEAFPNEEDQRPTLVADGALRMPQVSLALVRGLEALEPFGQGNREPRFVFERVPLRAVRRVGREGAHLQCQVGAEKAVGFGLGSLAGSLPQEADVLARIGIDTWQGTANMQFSIEDIRVADQMGASFPSMAKASVSSTPRAAEIL